MGISISSPVFTSQYLSDKPKRSALADAFLNASKAVMDNQGFNEESSVGAFAATEYGPSDIYGTNAQKLFSKGVRGLRAQVSAHSVLCEPSCITGIDLKINAVNNTIIGGRLSGFQAFAAASDALWSGMADAMLILGGDISDDEAFAGVLLMGDIHKDMIADKVITRFAYDLDMVPTIEKEIFDELMAVADTDKRTYVITGKNTEFSDEVIDIKVGSTGFFIGLQRAAELLSAKKMNVVFIDSDKSGAVGGIIVKV